MAKPCQSALAETLHEAKRDSERKDGRDRGGEIAPI